MAFSSQLIQLPCTTFTSTPLNIIRRFPSPATLTFPNVATHNKSWRSATRKVMKAAALDDDSSSYTDNSFSVEVLEGEEVVPAVSEVEELKKELVYLFYGTNRGLNAASETRAEIAEVVSKLEAKNPTAAPMEALTVLNGKWILAYTSFVGLYPLLSSGLLPLLKVEEISQTIDAQNLTVQNAVVFSGPLATTSISTNATYEVKSPKRVQIKFEEGVIGTPQITDFITIPYQLQIFGQDIDIPQLKSFISSVQDTANSVAKSISTHPPLKFSISHTNAQSWLLTTYLDEDVRVTKLDDGSAFILIKEGSPLLTP